MNLFCRQILQLIVFFVAGASTVQIVRAQQPEVVSRKVELVVDVVSLDGSALWDVPIQVFGKGVQTFAVSKVDAHAVFSINVETGTSEVKLCVTGPNIDGAASSACFYELLRHWNFDPAYVIPVEEHASRVDFKLKVPPAIRVIGRVLDPRGKAVNGVGIRTGGRWWPADGELRKLPGGFDVGVPKGKPSEIVIETPGVAFRKQVPASDQNIYLDNIVVPDTGLLSVGIRARSNSKATGATTSRVPVDLISLNGEAVYVGDALTPGASPHVFRRIMVPAGEYYIVPTMVGERWQLADLARAGEDLRTRGIPRVEIRLGHQQGEIDVEAITGVVREIVGGKAK